MQKTIQKITNLQFTQNAVGFTTVDTFNTQFNYEPFLVFTEFFMDRPIFGPHPHAGVSVLTYMLPNSQGAFLNRDSQGDSSIIAPGGMHVTQAGSGIKHDEVPTVAGTPCHGLQIWINHADAHRLVAPKAYHAQPTEINEHKTDDVLVRVLQGQYQNAQAPFNLVTQTTLLDITLQPNATITIPAMPMAFIYLISGTILVNNKEVANTALINFETEGDNVLVQTANASANFIFASGTPHNEPIVASGPFVMTTNEQMLETKRRLTRGEMGNLEAL
jgi:quercetin 2,3-dioxygenase